MSIKCWDPACRYPDCLCAPCLEVSVLLSSRSENRPTVKMHLQGATPRQGLELLRKAIGALQTELDEGEKHHLGSAAPQSARAFRAGEE